MKILKIEFQNINSLKGNHEIDFTEAPFTASSLFAITGPTGSGKSTLLDVIALALFNQVPRLGKISKNEIIAKGALLTRNQKEASARIRYSCKSGIYESFWRISTNSRGNLRDYEMELFDTATGKAFDLKRSEVPAKNEQLIGLNYNQFIKSVLLAQGEFAQFLKAKKDERGEMLEKITGTGIYRLLGQRTFEKFREVNQDIQQQQTKIEIIRPKLLEEEKQKELVQGLTEKETACKPLEENISSLEKDLNLKESIAKLEKEIQHLKQEKAQAEKSLEGFEQEHGGPLRQHEKLRDVSEDLRSWNRLREELLELREELREKKASETRNLEEIERCLKTTGNFTRSEVSAENIAEKLEAFGKKISNLQESRREKLSSYENLKKQLKVTLSGADLQLPQADAGESLRWLETRREASKKDIREIHALLGHLDLENTDRQKQVLRTNLETARKAQERSLQINNLSQELDRLKTEQEKIDAKKSPLPGELEVVKNKVSFLSERLQRLQAEKENQMLRANLEQHRASLRAGEPCPLCGALEHPYSEDIPAMDDSLEKELQETENERNRQNHQLSTLTTSLRHLEDRLGEIKKEKELRENRLKTEKKEFLDRYAHLQQEGQQASWGDICKDHERQVQQIENAERQQRILVAVESAIPLHQELSQVLTQGRELKTELDGLYQGKDIHRDCRKLQDDWISFSQEQSSLQNQQKDLSRKMELRQKKLDDLEHLLKETIREQEFSDIPTAWKALLPEPEYHRLHTEREKLREKITARKTSMVLLESQLKELQKQQSGKTHEDLLLQLDQKRTQLKSLREACEELRRTLKNDHELHQELQALREQIKEKENNIRRWRLLNELIGDARGKKFNDFAQDLSLSQLLLLANVRLRDLSDRYKIDKPVQEEDDGLVAIDEHMGGQRRSVKTLSGGETFILSLAMALALSDLASRNVEINSLFIDEGFGTLDHETLDQTLDTLEKLQAQSSKTIGIISHVDSLKERIATQIQLERNGQGYSQLQIKG